MPTQIVEILICDSNEKPIFLLKVDVLHKKIVFFYSTNLRCSMDNKCLSQSVYQSYIAHSYCMCSVSIVSFLEHHRHRHQILTIHRNWYQQLLHFFLTSFILKIFAQVVIIALVNFLTASICVGFQLNLIHQFEWLTTAEIFLYMQAHGL